MTDSLAYLEKIFSLNPRWESTHILQLRRDNFRLDAAQSTSNPTPNAEEAIEDVRSRGRALLRELQSDFFEFTEGELHERITTLCADHYRELSPAIDRLKVASEFRNVLASLSKNTGLDRYLIEVLSALTTRPAIEVRHYRELYIGFLTSRERTEAALATASYIETNHSALFQLERDWFTAIRRVRVRYSWWRILAIVIAILFLLVAIGEMKRPS